MSKPNNHERDDSVSIHIGGNADRAQIVAAGRDVQIGGQQFSVEYQEISYAFAEIYRQIEIRPPDPNVDKPEIQSTVENIESEVKKGDDANPNKVERWLRFLAAMAPDIFDVVAAALTGPIQGIHEMRKVAEMANLHHVPVAPHNICSPVGTMAAVHVCAAMPKFAGLEYHAVGVPWWQDIIQHEGPIIDDRGYIEVPVTPGIGVELNEEVVREHLVDGESYFD
jgi:hypothetical protein